MQIEIVEIKTPKNYILQGLWFGPKNPKQVIIAIHGLTSNLFSDKKYLPLVNDETAVFLFNNRGHDFVSKLKKINPNSAKGYDSEIAGSAHEVFEDCIDDIEAVVQIAENRGVKNIFLVGHSTGCQKSMFYISKLKEQKRVSGVVLIAPISDYSYIEKNTDTQKYEGALKVARQYIEDGTPHKLLTEAWPDELTDAQRFISLYTPNSTEEIFSYIQNEKIPHTYSSVKIPVLAMFAGADEYDVVGVEKLTEWFKKYTGSTHYEHVILPGVAHNLSGHEEVACEHIKNWMEKISV